MNFTEMPFWKRVVFTGGLFILLMTFMEFVYNFSTSGSFQFISELINDGKKLSKYILFKFIGFLIYGLIMASVLVKGKTITK